MSFDKKRFLSTRAKPVEVQLPDGQVIFIQAASANSVVDGLDRLRGTNGDPTAAQHLHFSLELVIGSAVDESGQKVFDDGDIVALKEMPRTTLQPLIEAVLKANGIDGQRTDPGKVSEGDPKSDLPSA